MEILDSHGELQNTHLSSFDKCLKNKKRVLIVTSEGSVKRGIIDNVKSLIGPFKEVRICPSVNGVPDFFSIDGLMCIANQFKPDVILSIGGGSVADASKIISLTSGREDICSSDLVRKNYRLDNIECVPIIFVVTLPGSGAELTTFATLWDNNNKKKYSIKIEKLQNLLTIYPISIIKKAPVNLLLYSALDALVHGFDSLWNVNATALTRKHSIEAIGLLLNAIKKIANGLVNDEVVRMLIQGSIFAGKVINITKTSICHSISYPITLHHDIPHGVAVFLPLLEILHHVDEKNPNLLRGLYEVFPSKKLFCDLDNILKDPKIYSYAEMIKTKSLVTYFDEMIKSERGVNFNVDISRDDLALIFDNLLSGVYSNSNIKIN
jgi:alcohol dehydrogenase class IV